VTLGSRAIAGRLGAIALGLALAAMPFLQLGTGAGHQHAGGAHSDHTPHRGGVLQMVGDHHIEIVVTDERVLAFVSDAWRRPLRASGGLARFDGAKNAGAKTREMTWHADHLETAGGDGYSSVAVTIMLQSGEELYLALPRVPNDER
jgi:hypothetical protein